MDHEQSCNYDADYYPSRDRRRKSFRRWIYEQNLLYIMFLKQQEENFKEQKLRRTKKVFKRLSQYVKTRDQNQCKSHHQKMLKHYKTIENIINFFSKKKVETIRNQTTSDLTQVQFVEAQVVNEMEIIQKQNEDVNEQSIYNVINIHFKKELDQVNQKSIKQ